MSAARTGVTRTVSAIVLVAILGLALLAAAGASDQRDVAFSLDIPPRGSVISIGPGRTACQGPFPVPAAFSAVRLWLAPVDPPGTTLRVAVRSSGSVATTDGVRLPAGAPTNPTIALPGAIPTGGRPSLCLENAGAQPLTLLGAGAGADSGTLTQGGRRLDVAASAVMLTPHPRSLLSLLPVAFRRAALFRPGWVGGWTFWVLLGGVLVALALAGVAVAQATREELTAPARTPPTARGSEH